MPERKPAMNMPELLVFARAFATGIVGTEVFRITFYLGNSFSQTLTAVDPRVRIAAVLICLFLCLAYAVKRGVPLAAWRLARSLRFDLLAAIAIGAWSNELVAPFLEATHGTVKQADPRWAQVVLGLLCTLLLSPLAGLYRPRSRPKPSQLYFIPDEEVANKDEDLLEYEAQAKPFAETVLASGAHPGLVYGVDGPWGVGKTSFINLAERHWQNSPESVIVCRFEPLRYASEPDLSERLIRDLSAAIQKQVFVPEFRPTASRYSRLLKGKADLSFLGFKLSLEPSNETMEELLDDIDDVLKRIRKRVIIVVDDLDRLDPKTVKNVLFATRRTFRLSQATYVLCYDTDILARGKDDESKAREFLEKFVTVKLSLFVDSQQLQQFLRTNWQLKENQLGSIPSDTLLRLGSVLSELANILGSEESVQYLPLVGDLRKLKRFVNAMLFIQIDKTDFSKTDFHLRDLINLMLLHLNYPGLFRRIYAEETEGRSGAFSIKRVPSSGMFVNSDELTGQLERHTGTDGFLLRQLFDMTASGISSLSTIDEAILRTRAGFNQGEFRNLEKYLKLIVRFAVPEPQNTFVLYQDAVTRVRRGTSIRSVLESTYFRLEGGEHSHDQFWRVLVNQSYDFTHDVAEDAINTLVEYLPRYSTASLDDRGLRQRSIYSLNRLLDRAGWGRTQGRRDPNRPEYIVEIAWRIFGEHTHQGKGLIETLASGDRGALGWYDLMLFRLQCSADRGGQIYNVHSALIVHEDMNARTVGLVSELALHGMRRLSQEVFARFKNIGSSLDRVGSLA